MLSRIFLSRWFVFLIAIIALQQVLVALGTFFLGKLSNEFPIKGFQTDIVLGLFISIFLPGTIIHYLLELCLIKTVKSSQFAYLNQYSKNNFNHPTHFRSQDSKEKKHDIMCRSGQEAINKALFFFSDLSATSLNIIFNTLSIALVTDVYFGTIIFVAGFLGIFIIYVFKGRISQSSRDEMLADTKLNEHLSKGWDNIILGNRLFYERWMSLFFHSFQQSEKASIDAARKKNLPIAIAGMVTNGIVLSSALIIIWLNQNNLGIVMSVLVMLPRSLQVVMHIQICQSYLAQWRSLKEKLIITQESLEELTPADLHSHIVEDKIKANNNPLSIIDLINTITKLDFGRITISGENGTGKSTLMLILKQTFGPLAVYLPAHHQFILKESRLKLSSGEAVLSALQDIQNEDCKIFLLDEWDANLSADNKVAMERMLAKLSLKKIVVEIRHGH